MEFYKDIINQRDPNPSEEYKYFEWNEESIAKFWQMCNLNPILRSQYYPIKYWVDLLDWFKTYTKFKNGVCADVGCGGGNMIECLLKIIKPESCIGIDLTEESLQFAKTRFADNNVEFKMGNFLSLPLPNESVDLITTTEVLEHCFFNIFEKAFEESSRVLKRGGYFLGTIPFNEELALVHCPHCSTVFTPYQHMIFDIQQKDIIQNCEKNGMIVVSFYRPTDYSIPKKQYSLIIKKFSLFFFPRISSILFRKAGATAFLARKI